MAANQPAPMPVSSTARARLPHWKVFAALAGFALFCPTAFADDPKAILVLQTNGYESPARIAFDGALQDVMRESPDTRIDLFIETVDNPGFRRDGQARQTRQYLRDRYTDKNIAVVVTVGARALDFVLDPADALLPNVPIAALMVGPPRPLPDRVSVVRIGSPLGASAALALKLHPRTQQIAFIDAALPNASNDPGYNEALRQIKTAAGDRAVIELRNLPLDALVNRVQALPASTIVIVFRQFLGRNGVRIATSEAFKEIARVSPSPIYVSLEELIGSGAVGGMVLRLEQGAKDVAALALRIAKDPSLRVPETDSPPVAVVDWRELRRWGIDESLLPPGAVVLFRQPGLWNDYQPYMIGAIAIVALQAALIAGLVVQGVKRRRVQRALRESDERFRRMADGAPVMIWTATPEMAVDFLNRTVLEFTGLSLEELRGMGWLERVHPDDVDRYSQVYARAFEARRAFRLEYRLRRADGSYRWLLDTGVPRFGANGVLAGYIGSALDITERKELEQTLLENQDELTRAYEQNQDLAGRLINAQEAERRRIARDLHDDMSQQLAGLSIMLSALKRAIGKPGNQADIDSTVATLQDRAAAIAEAVRNLSHELHPNVLEHGGLVAAMTRHCEEIERLHHLKVIVTAVEDLEPASSDVALVLFRVAQEALGNVLRHASARTIRLQLSRAGDGVELSIRDDGVGFVPDEQLGRGLGLRSIDERVRLARGTVRLESQPGAGTTLVVHIPDASVPPQIVGDA